MKAGKKPTPDFRQVPYVRVNLTASPPVVCRKRVCSPRANNGLPHVAHFGRSSSGFWLHFSVSPICTTSWISCARNWFIRSSTAASISAHVAFGCSLRHWVIPNTSRNPALTCCICGLRSRLFFLAFMLSSLSWSFFLYSTTSLLRAKNETHPYPLGE